MRFASLLTLCLTLCLLLVLSGCEKDELLLQDPVSLDNPASLAPELLDESFEPISDARVRALRGFYKKDLFSSGGKSSGVDFDSVLTKIITDTASVVVDPLNNREIATFFIPTENYTSPYNMVVSFQGDSIEAIQIYQYNFGDTMIDLFLQRDPAVENYSASATVYPGKNLASLFNKDGLADCFKIDILGNLGSPGRGGGNSNDSGNTGTIGDISGPIGGSPGDGSGPGDGTGSDPNSNIVTHCARIVYDFETGRANYYAVDCRTGEPIYVSERYLGGDQEETNTETEGGLSGEGKNLKSDDCGRFFRQIGIVPFKPSPADLTDRQTLALQNLLPLGLYNRDILVNAIGLDNLLACSTSECVMNHIIGYINDAINERFPDGVLRDNVSSNFSHEQLLAMLNIVHLSNGNEHAMNVISFLAGQENSSAFQDDPLGTIASLSALSSHMTDYEEFKQIAEKALALLDLMKDENAYQAFRERLVNNPDHINALTELRIEGTFNTFSLAALNHYGLEEAYGIDFFDGSLQSREGFFNANSDFFAPFFPDESLDDPGLALAYINRVSHNAALIRNSDPAYWDQHKTKLLFKAMAASLSEGTHLFLDLAGMFPALGAIPDGINVVFYAIEGDWENAKIASA